LEPKKVANGEGLHCYKFLNIQGGTGKRSIPSFGPILTKLKKRKLEEKNVLRKIHQKGDSSEKTRRIAPQQEKATLRWQAMGCPYFGAKRKRGRPRKKGPGTVKTKHFSQWERKKEAPFSDRWQN